MARVGVNGIEIEYEIHGTGEPLVLIMGIGATLANWPAGLLDALIDRGFKIVLLDNRDAGLSSHLDELGVPPLRPTIVRGILGRPVGAPYTLLDMADDVAGLLDALAIDHAHVLGVSLGGMVAQSLAIAHPARVRTLTSVMSTTGGRLAAIPRPRALKALLGKAPRTEDEAVAHMINFRRVCGSTAFPFDEAMHTELARAHFRRGMNPRGFLRQLAAVFATGDRSAALRLVRAPALVMHGSADPLIPPSGGRATARAIPGARLRLVEGWGHDLPREMWPVIADAVADLAGARAATGATSSAA